jgi:hypothetical protein
MSKLTATMVDYILEQSEKIQYGKIIIELRDNANFIDIIKESRNRFEKSDDLLIKRKK